MISETHHYDPERVAQIRKQYGCSKRMACRIIRLNLKPTEIERRMAGTMTGQPGSNLRTRPGNGHRGPRKGPSKPGHNGPKGGTKEWRNYMGG